jgi:hypothetical protein
VAVVTLASSAGPRRNGPSSSRFGDRHGLALCHVVRVRVALRDPVPHPIDAAIVGDPTGQARTVDAVEHVAEGSLVFGQYPSAPTCT